MLRQWTVCLGCLVAGALLGTLLWGQSSVQAAPEGVAKYHVVASSAGFILLETDTGQSWVSMPQPSDKKFAWFPMKRLDNDQQVQVWRIGGKSE